MMEMIFDPQYRSIVVFLVIIAVAGVAILFFQFRLRKKARELEKYESPFMPRNIQVRPDD